MIFYFRKILRHIYYQLRLNEIFDIKKNEHQGPWDIPLVQRQEKLKKSLTKNKKNIIIIYSTASSTFRYRCYNIFQATQKSSKYQAVYFSINEWRAIRDDIKKASLIVFQRVPYDNRVCKIAQIAKAMQIPISFDIDDLLCHEKFFKIADKNLLPKHPKELLLTIKDYQKTAELADNIIVTNDFLGKKLSEVFKKAYKVIPNSLNNEQVNIKYKDDKKFAIGYFSGSPTHDRDFALICEEIDAFLSKHKEAKMLVVGKVNLMNLHNISQVTKLSFVDFVSLQKLINSVDINLAPLIENDFTNCKSELKFFESAIANTVTIASPVYSFKNSIQNRQNGFLCKPGEWYNTINYLYEKQKERLKIAGVAKEYCLNRYCGQNFLKQVEKVYDEIAK